MKNTSLLASVILLGSIGSLLAGPLQEAKINQIVNDVKVVDPQKGARPAVVQDTVRDQIAVRTGIQSRAELLFQDATLTRLGAETFFSFKAGTRDLSLERGTMLLQVPKNRGGARIRTASVTASITGTTIMIENEPGKHVKVLVLEGSLRLSANGRFGESINLTPGKMIIMEAKAKSLPNPVDVDIRKIVKTSSLVDAQLFKGKSRANVAQLPSMGLIDKEIALQASRIGTKNLVPTNLVIAGKGTSVIAASDEAMADLEKSAARGSRAATSPLLMAQRRSRSAATDGSSSGDASASTVQTDEETASNARNAAANMAMSAGMTSARGAAPTGAAASQSVSNLVNTIASGGSPQASASDSGSGSSGSSVIQSIIATGGSSGSTTTTPTTTTTTTTTPPVTVGSSSDLVVSNFTAVTGALSAVGRIMPSGGIETGSLPYTISAASIAAGAGLSFPGADGTATTNPHAGGYLTYLYAPAIDFSPSGINGANMSGGAAVTGAGGHGGDLWIGSILKAIPGRIDFDAPITASSGANGAGAPTGGNGGSVSAISADRIRVASTIKVSDSAAGVASARGGSITLTSKKTSGTAIQITNSGQLLSLLDAAAAGPGGSIRITSSGGTIDVNGGRLQADRGTVEVKNNGASGNVTLTNANIRGDTVKIGALGASGQLLIGRGTINADTTLKLYGGSGNGAVRFTDDVTLSGASTKIIAGNTVTIDNGRTVTVGGPAASVHTNNPNYTGSGGNGSTTGQFGGSGATTQSFGSRPAF